MSRVRGWLASRSGALVLSSLVVAAALLYGAIHLYPYPDDVTPAASAGNDWLKYEQNALSIIDGGLLMPSVPGPYWVPGGFLYNYFVASIYAVFGPRSSYVYVVQFGCVALGAVISYALARKVISPLLAAVYLIVTAVFLFDAFRWWVALLLSENLAIVLYPLALLLFAAGLERRSLPYYAAAGLVVGLVILTRPNLLIWPVLLAPLALWPGDRLPRRIGAVTVFALGTIATASLLALRNYSLTGHLVATRYSRLMPRRSTHPELGELFRDRLLYSAGILVSPRGVEINKRWLLIVAGGVAGVIFLAVTRRLRRVDVAVLLTIVAALGPFVMIPALGGYGMRFQLPYGPLFLLLLFRAVHEWRTARPLFAT